MRLAEGHVMSDTAMVPRKSEGEPSARRPVVDDELADQLLGQAQAEGVELLGPDGLLSRVTKAVLERLAPSSVHPVPARGAEAARSILPHPWAGRTLCSSQYWPPGGQYCPHVTPAKPVLRPAGHEQHRR
jgi:hypothetical protein